MSLASDTNDQNPPKTGIERDPALLDEILPWYLNGSLDESDAAWVKEQLSNASPVVLDAREFDAAISSELQSRAAEVPAGLGWEKLLGQVRREAAPAQVSSVNTSRSFGDIFASWFSPRLGMALAAVLAVQTVAVGFLVNNQTAPTEFTEYRSVGTARPIPVLRVTFSDTVNEKQLREVLFANGASIIDGPNQLGEFFLVAGTGGLTELGEKLKTTGLVVRSSLDQKVVSR